MRVGSLIKWTEADGHVYYGIVTKVEEQKTFILWADGLEIDYCLTSDIMDSQMEVVCE